MTYRLPICVLCDEGYTMHLGAMLCSLLCNCRKTTGIELHVLDDGISEDSYARLMSLEHIRPFRLIRHDITQLEAEAACSNQDWPASLYKRLKVASILNDLDRVLLLDADTIIMEDPLDLFQQDLKGAWLGGVPDALAKRNNIRLGLPPNVPYVNFGVLLLDLEAWRNNNVEELLLNTLRHGGTFKYMDQDVLNLTLYQHITTFESRWNSQFINDRYTPKSRDDFSNPAIIHYITKEKPWLTLAAVPRKHYYIRYLLLTPWRNEWKEKIKKEKKTFAPWFYRLRHFFKEGFQIHLKHGKRYIKFAGFTILNNN